jgi:predicted metalloendopeptidase
MGMTPPTVNAYAQWACQNDRPEDQRLHANTDPHSPGRNRVNGLMVSANRCRVWWPASPL